MDALPLATEMTYEIFNFIISGRNCSFMNFPLTPYELLLPDALGCQKHQCVQRLNRKIRGRTVHEGLKQKCGQTAIDCWQLGECNGEEITALAWLVPCAWGGGLGLLRLLCWPFLPPCPCKGRSRAKWVLTWGQLQKSEHRDKSFFPCFSLACRRKEEKADDAPGG